MDDTLYDERTFVVSGFHAVAGYVSDRFHVDQQGIFSAMMEVFSTEGRGKVFDKALERCGLYSPTLVEELVHVYRSHQPQITLYPDVIPALTALKECGVKLGIVTDGLHSVQKRKVAALGLIGLVDVIVYTDELGRDHWKPSPVGFLCALERLAVEPTRAAYVGNDPAKDFAGPKAMGMLTVHLDRSSKLAQETDCEAQAHIAELAELVQLVAGKE
ncbi:MAG: HAD family hydrolase [Chloroflexi bacterium]|nr:HAD family hydrolase [Chloroflexota bacterium]